jgi:hypothetical protein
LARRLSKQQLKAIHAKNGSGISSRSHRKTREIPLPPYSNRSVISRPAKKPAIIIPKGDIRSHLTEAEIQEWEKAVGSELVSAETGKFEGRETVEVKFQNGENWFEFQTIKDQSDWFTDYYAPLDKIPKSDGEFIELDHPKIEGYITLKSGISLFKDRMMGK